MLLVFFQLTSHIFVLPSAGEMPVLEFSPVPPGVVVALGVYCCGSAEAASLAFPNGLWFAL